MKRLAAGLSLALLPLLAFGQDDPTSKADKKLNKILNKQSNKEDSGIDDDDLLDADLDDEAVAPPPESEVKKATVVEPPAAAKSRIEREAKRIGVRSDAIGKELFEELITKFKNSPKTAQVEIERRIRSCDERLVVLNRQLARISAKGEAPPPSNTNDPYGYGTPVVPYGRKPTGGVRLRVSVTGAAQFRWWQKLLVKSMEGVPPQLQKLVERRMNELKSDADGLSLTLDPAHRAFADRAVRTAIEANALGRGAVRTNIDRRLNDLFTFGKKTKKTTNVPAPRRRVRRPNPDRELTRFMGLSIQKFMLPRVKDPSTGRIRVFVNDRLGELPKR